MLTEYKRKGIGDKGGKYEQKKRDGYNDYCSFVKSG